MFIFFLPNILAKQLSKVGCQVAIDVGFMLDSSSSIGKNTFQEEIIFFKNLAERIGVGSSKSRIAAMTFGRDRKLNIKLNDYSDIKSFNEALDGISTMGDKAKLDEALYFAQQKLFSLINGGRAGVSKFLIITLNGSSINDDSAQSVARIANALQSEEIKIFFVAISNLSNKTKKAFIVHDKLRLFVAKNMDEFRNRDYILPIKKGICETGKSLLIIQSLSGNLVEIEQFCISLIMQDGLFIAEKGSIGKKRGRLVGLLREKHVGNFSNESLPRNCPIKFFIMYHD